MKLVNTMDEAGLVRARQRASFEASHYTHTGLLNKSEAGATKTSTSERK